VGGGKPETFNFLGFTHICGQARKNGKFLVLRKTIHKRLLAKLKEVKNELRKRMHQPLAEVGRWLRSMVQGYFNYHAVPGNIVGEMFGSRPPRKQFACTITPQTGTDPRPQHPARRFHCFLLQFGARTALLQPLGYL
jgi:hypothetical protein